MHTDSRPRNGCGTQPPPDSAREDGLTERQRRERDYYNQFSQAHVHDEIDFAPILGDEARPWNPYWFAYQTVHELRAGAQARLLDIGCGAGVDCVRYARLGFDVHGIDVSPGNIARARSLAARHDSSARVHVQPMVSEQLQFPDETFDVVTGIDILHHVEIGDTVAECLRVLKPGGVAVFKEWIEAPVLDRVRRLRPIQRMVPSAVSLDDHITEDERKLGAADLAAIRALCPGVEVHPFRILSRLDRFWPPKDAQSSWFERIDRAMVHAFPPLGRLAGAVVIVLRK